MQHIGNLYGGLSGSDWAEELERLFPRAVTTKGRVFPELDDICRL